MFLASSHFKMLSNIHHGILLLTSCISSDYPLKLSDSRFSESFIFHITFSTMSLITNSGEISMVLSISINLQ